MTYTITSEFYLSRIFIQTSNLMQILMQSSLFTLGKCINFAHRCIRAYVLGVYMYVDTL